MLLTLVLAVLAAAPIGAQEVVESAAPRDPDLTIAEQPLVRIGMLDGPLEYIFGNVTGAVRLDDGSIVVVDEQSHNVRRYDANGRHLWTSGREGDGPGEYRGLRLLRNCPGAAITVFDWVQDRITDLDADGNVVDTRQPQLDQRESVRGTRLLSRWTPRLHAVAGRPAEHPGTDGGRTVALASVSPVYAGR